MAFATGFEGLIQALPFGRRDLEFGVAKAPWPWFSWGYITKRGEMEGWYVLIMLPSYLMATPMHLGPRAEPRWHQRALAFVERIGEGRRQTESGWMMVEMECPK